MSKKLPQLYGLSIENINQRVEDFIDLGYSKDEVIKMTKGFPSIYSYSRENIMQKIDDLKDLGYTQEDIIKMTKSLPTIYGYSMENIKQKINDLESFGFGKDEVITMTKGFPELYSLSTDNINQRMVDLKDLGYNQEEVVTMTKGFPALFGLSLENIKQKVEFYNSINLHSLPINDSKRLMQSTALTYARYMFYKDNGIQIDENNYYKLFIGQKRFEIQFGVKKDELLSRYNYTKYQEQKSTQELGRETLDEQNDTRLLDEISRVMTHEQKSTNKEGEERA